MSEHGPGTKLGARRSTARAEAAPAYRARREEIIAAAGRAFLAKGYRATSFRDIADAVGVDRASLYYYFESKHELFRAATSVAVQRNVAEAESIARLFQHDSTRNLIRVFLLQDRLKGLAGRAWAATL